MEAGDGLPACSQGLCGAGASSFFRIPCRFPLSRGQGEMVGLQLAEQDLDPFLTCCFFDLGGVVNCLCGHGLTGGLVLSGSL